MITVQIGMGFVVGCVLTLVFIVSWVRSVLSREKLSNLGTAMETILVRGAGRFAVRLLAVPEVNAALTNLIAGGINAWLVNPDAQAHIETLISKTPQREAARELGKRLPGLASSFTKGMFAGVVGRQDAQAQKNGVSTDPLPNQIASPDDATAAISEQEAKQIGDATQR